MKREFRFEFDDESEARVLTYESAVEDVLTTSVDSGVPCICGNAGGLLTLARILVQMALGDYPNGFHVHLQRDLDPDQPDCLTVMRDRRE